jgi:hypothetical protein
VYFTETAKAYPQAVNADATIKPGAVRGRNIEILFGERGVDQVRLPGVQTVELEATIDGEVEREMGNPEITGRVVNGTDVTGTVTIRPKDIAAFFNTLSLVTGRGPTTRCSTTPTSSRAGRNPDPEPEEPGQILKTSTSRTASSSPRAPRPASTRRRTSGSSSTR